MSGLESKNVTKMARPHCHKNGTSPLSHQKMVVEIGITQVLAKRYIQMYIMKIR